MGDAGGSDGEVEKEKESCLEEKKASLENEGNFGGPRFNPPLYRQRYSTVLSALRRHDVSKVADFGCAECKFVALLREMQELQNIWGVDIDPLVLNNGSFKVQVRASDFLWPRDEELRLQLLCGSLVDYDSRLKGVEAVTMIELIEHLDPEPLAAFPANVFGRLAPRLVVITTPNSEFNVLFPDFSGFRHWDHRFEWTRKEFSEWCDRICEQYGYTVELSGIGAPPEGQEELGCCSQMALFLRKEDHGKEAEEDGSSVEEELPYKVVTDVVFKGKPKLSVEEMIHREALYCINVLLHQELQRRGGFWDNESCYSESPNYSDSESPVNPTDPSESCSEQTHDCDTKTQDQNKLNEGPNVNPNVSTSTSDTCSSTQPAETVVKDSTQENVHSESKDSDCEKHENEEKEPPDNDSRIPLALSDILTFRKMESLCEGEEEKLRSVLESTGYELSKDNKFVLCDRLPDSDAEGSETEDFDNGYPGDDCHSNGAQEEDVWDTDEEAEGFVAKGDLLRNRASSVYVCQLCCQLMDRVRLGNKWLPLATRSLCTYCYGNHCRDCHILMYSDTLTYEEQYAEWTPVLLGLNVGSIAAHLKRVGREIWDGSVPWIEHKFNLNHEHNKVPKEHLPSLLSSITEIDSSYLEWGL